MANDISFHSSQDTERQAQGTCFANQVFEWTPVPKNGSRGPIFKRYTFFTILDTGNKIIR